MADATDMLYGSDDFAAFAAGRSLGSAPEETWNYSSGTANIIARIVRHEAQKQYENYYGFIREALFDRIGMPSAVMEADPSGTFVGSSYAFATARDWARFGLLYLQDGMWNGERVLPEGWVTYTTTPTPKAPRGEYGALVLAQRRFFRQSAVAPCAGGRLCGTGLPGTKGHCNSFQEAGAGPLRRHRRSVCLGHRCIHCRCNPGASRLTPSVA